MGQTKTVQRNKMLQLSKIDFSQNRQNNIVIQGTAIMVAETPILNLFTQRLIQHSRQTIEISIFTLFSLAYATTHTYIYAHTHTNSQSVFVCLHYYMTIMLFLKRILIVSSKSSKSHSMLRKEFLSSVVVHSTSALPLLSLNSRQRRYRPRVLFNALNTSLVGSIDRATTMIAQ